MKKAALIVVVLLIAGGIATYAVGAREPVNHSVTVSGVIEAPQQKVFSLIADVAHGDDWRPAVKSVTVLQQDNNRDHWVEHLAHGRYMTFIATRNEPPFRREVMLDDRNASYGGTWVYELSPGPSENTTILKITESGYIHSPEYRFLMRNVIGLNHHLDEYMRDIKAAAKK